MANWRIRAGFSFKIMDYDNENFFPHAMCKFYVHERTYLWIIWLGPAIWKTFQLAYYSASNRVKNRKIIRKSWKNFTFSMFKVQNSSFSELKSAHKMCQILSGSKKICKNEISLGIYTLSCWWIFISFSNWSFFASPNRSI